MGRSVSLVLSGGGARGIAHIGVLEVLLERGYHIQSIAGTSMGALVGGVYATGNLPAFRQWLCNLDLVKVLGLIDFALLTPGLLKGDRLFQQLSEFMPDTLIESLPLHYAAVATDLAAREEVVFREGSLFEAVRASIAIPTVFTPVQSQNRILVDGGVLNNIPVNQVHRQEGDLLVVVDVNAEIPAEPVAASSTIPQERLENYRRKLQEFNAYLHRVWPRERPDRLGYFDLITQTISLMTNHMAQLMLQQYKPDVLIQVSRDACGLFDFLRAEDLIAWGRQAAERSLQQKGLMPA